jgi:ribosomal RNA-processing protein 8
MRAKSNLKVADLGCGDARLAKTLKDSHEVFSFDLVSCDEQIVTACDIAQVPLENQAVDVAVFCLSLMGRDFLDFIREANRILKNK